MKERKKMKEWRKQIIFELFTACVCVRQKPDHNQKKIKLVLKITILLSESEFAHHDNYYYYRLRTKFHIVLCF